MLLPKAFLYLFYMTVKDITVDKNEYIKSKYVRKLL